MSPTTTRIPSVIVTRIEPPIQRVATAPMIVAGMPKARLHRTTRQSISRAF